MEAKEIASQILSNAGNYKVEIGNIKVSVENFLKRIILDTKNTMNAIPDKETFMKVIAEMGDTTIDFTKIVKGIAGEILERIDDKAMYQTGKLLDKFVITPLMGENWYQQLVIWVDSVTNEVK